MKKKATSARKKKSASGGSLKPGDWFAAAAEILKTKGFFYLTIRDLGALLGVSTGSFYHHFQNREDFLNRFFDHLLEEQSLKAREVIEASKNSGHIGPEPINSMANASIDHRLEASLRAMSLFDPIARDRLSSIDVQRRTFIAGLYGDQLDEEEADLVPLLHLVALVGAQFVIGTNTKKINRLGAFVNALLAGATAQPDREILHRALLAAR